MQELATPPPVAIWANSRFIDDPHHGGAVAIAIIPDGLESPTGPVDAWTVFLIKADAIQVLDTWALTSAASDFKSAVASLDGDFVPRGMRRLAEDEADRVMPIILDLIGRPGN